jgi:hypothetical protein
LHRFVGLLVGQSSVACARYVLAGHAVVLGVVVGMAAQGLISQ